MHPKQYHLMTGSIRGPVHEASGAAEGGAPAEGTEGAKAPDDKEAPAAGSEGAGEAPVRPDYVPEKFWDAKTGVANVEGLATAYGELEKKQFTKNDLIRKEVEDAFHAERNAARPEAADKYEMPTIEGVEWQDGDPLINFWRETAFNAGMNQEAFNSGIETYVQAMTANMPDYDAEVAALGENGPERIELVNGWMGANLSAESADALQGMATTAAGVAAIEELLKSAGADLSLGTPGGGAAAAAVTKERLNEMMQDERYWHPTKMDKAYREEVTKGWQKLFEGQNISGVQSFVIK